MSFLITSVLNPASDRLAISSVLSFLFSGALICLHVGHIFFVPACLLCSNGQSLRYSPGQDNPLHCICGGGVWEGTMQLAQLSSSFQSLPPLPTIYVGPSGAYPWVSGFVYMLGCCGSLHRTLLWGWEFFLPPEHPQVFSEVLRLYFSVLEPWVAWCVLLSSCSSQFILMQMWDHQLSQPAVLLALVLQPLPFCESSPPQLPISAPPTGLDECFFLNSLVVGLRYSSIFWQFWLFFVFYICCLPPLGVRGGKVYQPMPPAWPLRVCLYVRNK